MVTVHIDRFKLITGVELDHFTQNIFRGDNWGMFLKIANVLESASKRAIALKLGKDPNSQSVSNIRFSEALKQCKELSLITEEAFNFADSIRKVRNDLVHNGNILNLDIKKMNGEEFYNYYIQIVLSFVEIQGFDITKSEKQHFNTLVMAVMVFVGLISKEIYQDDWLANIKAK